jgi:phage shock protein E
MTSRTRALVAGLMLGTVVLAGCSSSSADIETVSPQSAATIIADDSGEVILDIRTPEEYDQGIIEGAINIDFYEPTFASDLDALDKDAHYVVYCRSGNRSGQAMGTFGDLGFTNVTEIDGGIADWYETGLPVVLP